jgi:hypothetical protein
MKTKTKSATATYDHAGRPKYRPSWPRSQEWTFADLMTANGVETNSKSKTFGKGPNCSMLTLRKFMDRDAELKDGSEIVTVMNKDGKPVTCKPNSKSGLGRHALVYSLRNAKNSRQLTADARKLSATGAKPAPVARKVTRKAKKTVAAANADYEAQKAALLTPTPAVVITTPAPAADATPAPVAPAAAAPVTAPVVEVPIANEAPAATPAEPTPAPAVA